MGQGPGIVNGYGWGKEHGKVQEPWRMQDPGRVKKSWSWRGTGAWDGQETGVVQGPGIMVQEPGRGMGSDRSIGGCRSMR